MKRSASLFVLAFLAGLLAATAAARPAVRLAGPAAVPRQVLNGREVALDGEGKILPWAHPDPAIAYSHIIELDAEFLRQDVQLELGYPRSELRNVEGGRDDQHRRCAAL